MAIKRVRARRNKIFPRAAVLALCTGALGFGSWAAARAPLAASLLDAVAHPPKVAYRGRLMVTRWYGRRVWAQEERVYYAPPSLTRREFLSPDGRVTRVSVSNGGRESVFLVGARKIINDGAAAGAAGALDLAAKRELLLKNYRLSVRGSARVAGRKTWVLSLAPRVRGKPRQTLWIDAQTRVVLENKRFLPNRPVVALARFSEFEPVPDIDRSLFALAGDSVSVVVRDAPEPHFLSIEDIKKAAGAGADFPERLPGGFVFESADVFKVGRHPVTHLRYTDGLAALSVFSTQRPVRLPAGAAVAGESSNGVSLSSGGLAEIVRLRRGRRYYTLMGDVSRDLLLAAAVRLR